MSRYPRLGAPLLILLLAACQQDAVTSLPSRAIAAGPPVPALCPPAGLVVRRSDGRDVRHHGRDRTDPEVCISSIVGQPGFWRDLHGLAPAGNTASGDSLGEQARAGLRPLVPLATGRQASYLMMVRDGGWQMTWRVVGDETITLRAGRFDTWVIEVVDEGRMNANFRGERRLWIDKATGATLRQDARVVRGGGRHNEGSWEAVAVIRGG
jgi:hypothetical protein